MDWQKGKVVSRPEFIRLVAKYVNKIKRVTTFLVVHHTDRPNYADWDRKPDGEYWFRVIDKAHKLRGWKGFGYHVLILPDGNFVLGRHPEEVGAHVSGYNRASLGIACLGNFNKGHDIPMRPEQYISFKYGMAALLFFCALTEAERANLPFISRLKFHRELNETDCPGSGLDKQYFVNIVLPRLLPDVKRMLKECSE